MLARPPQWLCVRHIPALRRALSRAASDDPRWPGWAVVVGIEVHAQIKSRHKLFSESRTSTPDQPPNTLVTPFDAAFPGTLPRLNPKCVELGVKTAIALDADVQRRSAFDRKHYFYADLPQATRSPSIMDGRLQLGDGDTSVRIKQIQLEQDTGKSTYLPQQRASAIDLNRAGTGLMEIVSEPDMRTPEQASDYVRTLQALLRAVGSSDGNMEQGSLRCDVNVSVNRPGSKFGTRCEIKNLNSVKFMQIAIMSEVRRHISLLEQGAPVPQETRGFDEDRAETYSLRSKEDAPDYRYMPDPNLPPLLLDDTYIARMRASVPELPAATRARLLALGLARRDADVLMDVDAGRAVGHDGAGAVAYFDAVAAGRDPRLVVNWITHELLGQLAYRRETFAQNAVSAAQMGDLVDLVRRGFVTGTAGKVILREMMARRSLDMPWQIAQELSLMSRGDGAELEKWCAEAIAALPEEAEVVRRGNEKVVNKIVGHVMKASRGTANAQAIRVTLLRMLQ
ncbi:Glutamyl-tRNA amidotransferase B subunit [Amylocystis lapponica]|nr:Glutamyl-tRNA amidotransferase B subunit [Amylocystis lapponica]